MSKELFSWNNVFSLTVGIHTTPWVTSYIPEHSGRVFSKYLLKVKNMRCEDPWFSEYCYKQIAI